MGCASNNKPTTLSVSDKPLTEEEKELFKEADANKDGKLSFDEIWKMCEGPESFPKIVLEVVMALCDSNGDKHINENEFSGFFKILSEVA